MKRKRTYFTLAAAMLLTVGMTAAPCQAAVYDHTGASGQTVSADAGEVMLYPGDSVANTDLYLGDAPVDAQLLEDGFTYGWKNSGGTVYRLSVQSETMPVEVAEAQPLLDEEGNPVLDPETLEPVYADPEGADYEETYTWYVLEPWGGTVEVAQGMLNTPSQAGYLLPPDQVYSYTNADGNGAQILSTQIMAGAYQRDAQVVLSAAAPEEGKVFQRWSVYTVEGGSLSRISEETLAGDPSLIPGLSPDMLLSESLTLTVTPFRSRLLFMPDYAAAASEQEEMPEIDPATGEPVSPDGAAFEYDPVTGEPVSPDGAAAGYDPVTGEPLYTEEIPEAEGDPFTGEMQNAAGGMPEIDPVTGEPAIPDSGISILDNANENMLNIETYDQYGTDPAMGQQGDVQNPADPEVQPQEETPVNPEVQAQEETPVNPEAQPQEEVLVVPDQDEEQVVAAQAQTVLLTLQNATSEPADLSGLTPGTTVKVTAADRQAEGLTFDRWNPTGITLDETLLTQPVITFQMPANDAALAAQYKEIPKTETVTVRDATIENVALTDNGDGTVSASVEDGTTVRIVANQAPEGQQFSQWELTAQGEVSASDVTQPTLDVTVNGSDVTAVPVYTVPVSAPQVTVAQPAAGGTISDPQTAPQGENTQYTFTLTPNPGYQIDSFTAKAGEAAVPGAVLSDDRRTLTFTAQVSEAPAPITVTAALSLAPHTLTVNSGTASGSGTYTMGETVTITADEPSAGWRFTEWTVSGGGTIADAKAAKTTFTMADIDAVVTANYEQISYTLRVRSGSGSGSYHSSDAVVIRADAPASGYRFSNWSLTTGNGTFASAKESQTTFTMSAQDAEVKANYELIPYTLTVKHGTGTGSYTKGTEVDIMPDFPVSGKEFDRWEKTGGSISFDSVTSYYATVTMKAGDATVTALYKDGPNPNNNQIQGLEQGAEYLKSTTLTFTAAGAGMDNNSPNPGDYRYRPASYQIGSVGGSWTASPYTTSMAINAVGDYTLTVTYAKDVYDGTSWNADGTTVTKSITFHVVNALSVKTGDSSPLIPLAIAGGAALAVIIILMIILGKRRKR